MKGLIISALIFVLLIVGTIINCFYVNHVHTQMSQMVSSISQMPCYENTVLICELKEFWSHHKSILSVSVSYDYIDDLTNKLDSLEQSNKSEDATQLAINIELLQNAIDAIIRLENIKIDNILKKQM